MSIKTSKHGTLVEPNLHDGYLLGIDVSRDDQVGLSVCDVSKKHRWNIVLSGVCGFLANEVKSGNIIFDVVITRGAAVREAVMERFEYGVDEPYRKVLFERVVAESLYVLELNPSYGCDLAAIARDIQIKAVD